MWLFIWIKLEMYYEASSTVHPLGIPLSPVGNVVIAGFFMNVPVAATPCTHESKQLVAEILVANIVILDKLVQPLNI